MSRRDLDSGMRRTVASLTVATAVLVPAGAFTGSLWLLAAGAWALIAAVLLEMVHRP
ncbi:hypothetical protein [Streptomyces sp. enrichment culture]|uniref:hypothetical protein n=1 Tax=Streptomyces sp. enrichment culture TaxID=1795815 RepID=UPI003F54F802